MFLASNRLIAAMYASIDADDTRPARHACITLAALTATSAARCGRDRADRVGPRRERDAAGGSLGDR
jgi:hypothetical protein